MNTTTPKTIEVIIDTAGNTTVETKGFAGTACRKATAELEKSLGTATADRLTPKAFQTQPTVDQQQHNG